MVVTTDVPGHTGAHTRPLYATWCGTVRSSVREEVEYGSVNERALASADQPGMAMHVMNRRALLVQKAVDTLEEWVKGPQSPGSTVTHGSAREQFSEGHARPSERPCLL
jgi:hypothetical protein